MFLAERHERILAALSSGGQSVVQLAGALGVSESTIRRDLDVLAKGGQLERLYGGAMLTQGSRANITDSGGVQEESAVFGIPTLIHRKATERSEGLGRSAVLSLWDMDIVRDFLKGADQLRSANDDERISPSDIIIDDLASRGYASPY